MNLRSRIVVRVVLILGALLLACFIGASGSMLISLKQHLLSGSIIHVQQSGVDLPPLWRIDKSQHRAKGLHLGRATFGTYEMQHLIIDFDVDGNSSSAEDWQSATLQKHPESSNGAHYKGEVIPTQHYIFYCVERDEVELSPVDLTCKAGRWNVVYYGGPEYLSEVRSILSSLQ